MRPLFAISNKSPQPIYNCIFQCGSMSSMDTKQLIAAIGKYVAANFGDILPVELSIKLETGQRIVLPVRPLCGKPTATNTHSADFRSIVWEGESYRFSTLQSAAIELLWRSWESDAPDLSQDYILTEIGSESRSLSDLFKNHKAWGKVVVGENGIYRLKS